MITIRCKSLIQRFFLLMALVSDGVEKRFGRRKRKRSRLSK
jgi:hypothetical protein